MYGLANDCAQVCRVVWHLAESAVAYACRCGFVTTFSYTYFCRFEKVRMRASAADIDHPPATDIAHPVAYGHAMLQSRRSAKKLGTSADLGLSYGVLCPGGDTTTLQGPGGEIVVYVTPPLSYLATGPSVKLVIFYLTVSACIGLCQEVLLFSRMRVEANSCSLLQCPARMAHGVSKCLSKRHAPSMTIFACAPQAMSKTEDLPTGRWPAGGIRLSGPIQDVFCHPDSEHPESCAIMTRQQQQWQQQQRQQWQCPCLDAWERIADVFGGQPHISTDDLHLGQHPSSMSLSAACNLAPAVRATCAHACQQAPGRVISSFCAAAVANCRCAAALQSQECISDRLHLARTGSRAENRPAPGGER